MLIPKNSIISWEVWWSLQGTLFFWRMALKSLIYIWFIVLVFMSMVECYIHHNWDHDSCPNQVSFLKVEVFSLQEWLPDTKWDQHQEPDNHYLSVWHWCNTAGWTVRGPKLFMPQHLVIGHSLKLCRGNWTNQPSMWYGCNFWGRFNFVVSWGTVEWINYEALIAVFRRGSY